MITTAVIFVILMSIVNTWVAYTTKKLADENLKNATNIAAEFDRLHDREKVNDARSVS